MPVHTQIFTQNFLNGFLEQFRLSNMSNVYHISEIIKNWNEAIQSGKIDNLKEEEIKSRFLMEIFGDVLGFNYKNTGKWLYREEVKTKTDGTKPDGALGLFHVSENGIENDVQIVIEVKSAKSDLDKPQNRTAFKITPIDQAFLYASKMGGNCRWVVVTNLIEIRFYHSGDQNRYQRYTIPELLNEDILKEFLFLFHRDRFFNGEVSKTTQLFIHQKQNRHQIKAHRHIVDELYYCLYRFDQLVFVDPHLLSNIKPFNILDEHVWHYSHYNLFTLNPEIFELLNGITIEKGQLIIDCQYEIELQKNHIIEYRRKLEYIFKKLHDCLINQISAIENLEQIKQKNKGVIGFTYRHSLAVNGKDGVVLELDYSVDKQCDCINCVYRSFDFKKLIKNLNERDGKIESETLSHAYAHYLLATDNYRTAYKIYKNIENKAKGNDKKYIEYFIAKCNLLHMHNLFFDDPDYAEMKKDSRSVDLDRVLNDEITLFVEEDVRKLLLEIKEDKIFNRAVAKANELTEKLKGLKSLYARGGTMFAGPNYVTNLAEEYIQASAHIQRNFIIHDAFTGYKELVASVFQGLVYSFQTKGAGLENFHEFFITEAILYVPRKRLSEILEKVGDLPVDDKTKQALLIKAQNYFQSYYHDGFFGDPRKDELIEKQLLNHRFQDKYTDIFNNLCHLFAHIDFTTLEFERVAIAIIKFIKVDEVLSWWHIEQLGELIKKRGYLFSNKQLTELLTISINSHRSATNIKYERLIKAASIALRKFYPDVLIDDSQLVKRGILNCYQDAGRADLSPLSDFWHILNADNKQMLTDAFEEYLDKQFNDHLYEHLLKTKVIAFDRKDYLMKLALAVNKSKGLGYTGIENNNAKFSDFACYNFLLIPYILDLDFDLPEFRALENLSEFERWLVNPLTFDYGEFKPEWLKAAESPAILKRLRGKMEIADAIVQELKRNFDKGLAKKYFEFFA